MTDTVRHRDQVSRTLSTKLRRLESVRLLLVEPTRLESEPQAVSIDEDQVCKYTSGRLYTTRERYTVRDEIRNP